MLWTRRVMSSAVMGCVFLALILAGCDNVLDERVSNIPPETTLSYSPEAGDTSNYRVRMNWFGWDPDGEIAHFMTKWDENDWRRVVSTDSVFYLSAALDEIDEDYAYEYHSFKVKAVDNEGMEDATPESVAFTAFTFVPETSFLSVGGGPTGATGPMVSFRWQASDRDGVIEFYDYHLLVWNATNQTWDQVVPPPAEGEWTRVDADITTASFGPLDGEHRFEVRAIDDAGAADQTPARRQFIALPNLAGPLLYIRSNIFEISSSPFRGPVWPPAANDAIPIFAGERLRFEWAATAQDYGGQVLGYRHAYDDTSTWPAWSIFDTRFDVAPTLGGHNLYVGAIDNANVQTRARVRFDVVEATLDGYILVVDDWDHYEDRPPTLGWGTDEDRTSFYDLILAGYVHERVEWEPSQNNDQPPDVNALRSASTVIWYADSTAEIGDLFDPDPTSGSQYNALAGYVRVGGNLLLCGRKVLSQVLNVASYPIAVSAEDTTQATLFVRDFLHVGYADNSGSHINKEDPWDYGYCFYGATPAPGWEGEFSPVYLDSVGPSGYPERGKWPVYTWQAPEGYVRAGLSSVERVESFQQTAEEILLMDAYLNVGYEDEPCGLLYLSGDNHGNSCYLGFPLYYCQYDDVQAFMDKILSLFGEEKEQGP